MNPAHPGATARARRPTQPEARPPHRPRRRGETRKHLPGDSISGPTSPDLGGVFYYRSMDQSPPRSLAREAGFSSFRGPEGGSGACRTPLQRENRPTRDRRRTVVGHTLAAFPFVPLPPGSFRRRFPWLASTATRSTSPAACWSALRGPASTGSTTVTRGAAITRRSEPISRRRKTSTSAARPRSSRGVRCRATSAEGLASSRRGRARTPSTRRSSHTWT